jgi:hypothetical protein
MDSIRYEGARARVRELSAANRRIAVHACLEMIFEEAVQAAPRTIVELGISKEALANKALVAAAELSGAQLISCDLYDFSDVCIYPGWVFLKGHAAEVGRQYRAYAEAAGNPPDVDVLLIDCDEKYETTREIWRAWKGNLSPACTVLFRCTNLQKILAYPDGTSTGLGWDNSRGVVRVLEDELSIRFDETKPFQGQSGEWTVRHIPWGAGLTALRRNG